MTDVRSERTETTVRTYHAVTHFLPNLLLRVAVIRILAGRGRVELQYVAENEHEAGRGRMSMNVPDVRGSVNGSTLSESYIGTNV